MQRRGVSRDALVGCLREMGREMPLASVRMLQVCLCLLALHDRASVWAAACCDGVRCPTAFMLPHKAVALLHAMPHPCRSLPAPGLQWAARRGMNTTILSDCNQTFM